MEEGRLGRTQRGGEDSGEEDTERRRGCMDQGRTHGARDGNSRKIVEPSTHSLPIAGQVSTHTVGLRLPVTPTPQPRQPPSPSNVPVPSHSHQPCLSSHRFPWAHHIPNTGLGSTAGTRTPHTGTPTFPSMGLSPRNLHVSPSPKDRLSSDASSSPSGAVSRPNPCQHRQRRQRTAAWGVCVLRARERRMYPQPRAQDLPSEARRPWEAVSHGGRGKPHAVLFSWEKEGTGVVGAAARGGWADLPLLWRGTGQPPRPSLRI